MSHFEPAHTAHQTGVRGARIAAAGKAAPVAAAIAAVLAALSTLFANHTSVNALAQKNEAILYQSKASDQYNAYETGRLGAQLDRSLLESGIAGAAGRAVLQARAGKGSTLAHPSLIQAQSFEAQSEQHFASSEKHMGAYESYEVAATLFQVSVVLLSIASLVRGKRMMFVAAAGTLAGLALLVSGFLQ